MGATVNKFVDYFLSFHQFIPNRLVMCRWVIDCFHVSSVYQFRKSKLHQIAAKTLSGKLIYEKSGYLKILSKTLSTDHSKYLHELNQFMFNGIFYKLSSI